MRFADKEISLDSKKHINPMSYVKCKKDFENIGNNLSQDRGIVDRAKELSESKEKLREIIEKRPAWYKTFLDLG